MGKPSEPLPAKLFMSLLAGEDDFFCQGMDALKKDFGPIDFVSEKFQFDFTDYYAKEMGGGLFRHFITFERLISQGSLPEIKLATNHLEEELADSNGNRRMNIDPGYLSHAHVILATTKAYAHRPYLEKGIYADLTLIYRGKSFQPLGWTYPDYRQGTTIELFNEIRKQYLEMIKEGKDHLC